MKKLNRREFVQTTAAAAIPATLFGQAAVRLPRFRCAECATTEAGVEWPPHARSTPELDRLRAQLSALMP